MTNIEKLVLALKKIPPLEQTGDRKMHRVIARALDKKGRILSTRTNTYTVSHPIQKHFAVLAGRPKAIYLHAEISALIAAKSSKVHTLLIARIDADGNPVKAEPCEICTIAIEKFGVKHIIHT